MTAGIKHKRFTRMEEADCACSKHLLNCIPLLDITFLGFSLKATEHLDHKLSSFISWMEQFSSARKCSWRHVNARGGQSITPDEYILHSLLRSDNSKNHWPVEQFGIPRLTELLWYMQDSNLLRRDNKQASAFHYCVSLHFIRASELQEFI